MVYVFVRTGSIFETFENNGISHALEHMLFKSSNRYSTLDIIKSLTLIGGEYNAITDKDVTYYYVKTSAEHWKRTLEILFSMLFDAKIKPEEWAKEKGVVLEEILNSDGGAVDLDMLSMYHKTNAYVKSVGGTSKTLGKITYEMLRKYYHDYYFNASNIDIVISCPKSFEKRINGFVITQTRKYIKDALPIEPPILTPPKPQVIIERIPMDKFQVTLTFQAYHVRQWKQHITLNFLNYMLAKSGLYSILMYELREKKGLLYGIHCHTDTYQYLTHSYIRFSTQNPNLTMILKSIFVLIEKIKTKGVNKNVLRFYKESYLNLLTYVMVDDGYSFFVRAMNHHYGVYDYNKDEYMKVVKDITNDDVIQCAKDVYNFEAMGVYVKGNIDAKKKKSMKKTIDSKNIYK